MVAEGHEEYQVVVAFLQNAWSSLYAGSVWPRESWLRALHASRSGQRLRSLTEVCEHEIWFDNTTPICGANPNSIIPPCLQHIKRVLESHQPDYVVGLGNQAADVLRPLIPHRLLLLPHPAYRVVTNKLYQRAGKLLNRGFEGRVALVQGRKVVKMVRLGLSSSAKEGTRTVEVYQPTHQ